MGHIADGRSGADDTMTGTPRDEHPRWRRTVYMVGTAIAYALAA